MLKIKGNSAGYGWRVRTRYAYAYIIELMVSLEGAAKDEKGNKGGYCNISC